MNQKETPLSYREPVVPWDTFWTSMTTHDIWGILFVATLLGVIVWAVIAEKEHPATPVALGLVIALTGLLWLVT